VAHATSRPTTWTKPGLAQLVALSPAITTEFENVPAAALATLAAHAPSGARAPMRGRRQDRARERPTSSRCGVPCAPYAVIDTPEQAGRGARRRCCPAS
jgi:5-(carboxyamino)imidazole ribonucleotide synthase